MSTVDALLIADKVTVAHTVTSLLYISLELAKALSLSQTKKLNGPTVCFYDYTIPSDGNITVLWIILDTLPKKLSLKPQYFCPIPRFQINFLQWVCICICFE